MTVLELGLHFSRKLVDVAMGRLPANLVIRGGQWVCVQSGEIVPDTDVAIWEGRIAYVGPDASHTIGEKTKVIEAEGRYLSPGLLDGHMHVESGMLTVTEFVRTVLPHGTTGMFIDPHEIANVFGLRGVRLMVDEAAKQPIDVYVQMPSCVPSAPGLETPGMTIGPSEVAEAMTWPGIIGLGEMMNFPAVFNSDDKVHAEMVVTRQAGKVIGGHYPSPVIDRFLHGYIAGGPMDDHESTTLEGAIARIRQGMRVMMRYGSAWHDVASQVGAVTEHGLDPRHFILCTDDSHSHTLMTEGHMDRVVRHAIQEGLKPIHAIQMATINTAEYFGVDQEIGMIAPGRNADILLVKDLEKFDVEMVIVKGDVVAEAGELMISMPRTLYPKWATQSVRVPREMTAADFRLDAGNRTGKVAANIIGVIENQALTKHVRLEVDVVDGEVPVDLKQDVVKIALVERHHNSGKVQVGLVQGFGFSQLCGIATTVAHDCHHMIVVGTNESDMAIAVNTLVACGGGQVVVKEGKVIGKVELPIAGLMSNDHAVEVSKQAATVLEGFKKCGCTLNNPNMQLSLLGLVVIPDLRISDLGLVDVNKFDFLPVLE